jgi:hypothetical protein
MVNAAGPEMDQGETVTVFNDLCVLAPAALVDAPIVWETIDGHHVRGAFTRGAHTVTALLIFNDAHELIDFVSDDRTAASSDGKQFIQQRWSTPLRGYRSFGPTRIATIGEGRWHAPDPEGEFTYIDFHVDDIVYNATRLRKGRAEPADWCARLPTTRCASRALARHGRVLSDTHVNTMRSPPRKSLVCVAITLTGEDLAYPRCFPGASFDKSDEPFGVPRPVESS